MAVGRIRVSVVAGAVLLWAVTPVLACLLPCLAAAPARQQCPHRMATHCGGPTMTAGRTCCQMSSRAEMATVETQVGGSQRRVFVAVSVVANVSLSNVTPRPSSVVLFESPPNGAPPPFSSVRRI